MADEQTPAAEPDMIAQVGTMLKTLLGGNWVASALADGVDDGRWGVEEAIQTDNTIVLASAILAVAAELRGVRNELSDWQRAWVSRQ